MRSPIAALLFAFAALCAAQTAPGPPTIGAVENNFSYTLAGLPNYGIAQGSIFVIFGTNLANAPSGLQAAPLQTTLDGVSVQVTVGGSTTQALLYHVMPGQIAGVLPSATPIGGGQIIVTNHGQTGSPSPITVVQSVLGIATNPASTPSLGEAAAAFDASFNPLSAMNSANPGDLIVLYGTGAGPISTNDAVTPPVQNLTGIPIEVDIGGVPAQVLYHGRSGYPGLDQLNVKVPEGVSGCAVSIVAVSSGLVSNTAFLSVSTQGRNCTNIVPGVVRPPETWLQGSIVNTGMINISRSVLAPPTVTTDSQTQIDDWGSAVFYRYAGGTAAQPLSISIGSGGSQFVSLGSCLVQTSVTPVSNSPASSPAANAVLRTTTAPTEQQLNIDAGPVIDFADSMGQSSIALTPSGYYNGGLGCTGVTCPPLFLSSSVGAISINNGKGGPDVGPFVVQMNEAPLLAWSNMLQLPSTLNRAQGLTLTWTGGNPTGVALIRATSSANAANGTVSAYLLCEVPNSASQFTIPASALLALPPGPGQVSIGSGDQSPVFMAQGLDGGVVNVSEEDQLTVTLQ